jgi:hypothetical protein
MHVDYNINGHSEIQKDLVAFWVEFPLFYGTEDFATVFTLAFCEEFEVEARGFTWIGAAVRN